MQQRQNWTILKSSGASNIPSSSSHARQLRTIGRVFPDSKEIRRLIYTTNTVEGNHRQIRKDAKNKGVFPSDTALEKLVYLAYCNILEKWTMPLANWALISQQLAIKF